MYVPYQLKPLVIQFFMHPEIAQELISKGWEYEATPEDLTLHRNAESLSREADTPGIKREKYLDRISGEWLNEDSIPIRFRNKTEVGKVIVKMPLKYQNDQDLIDLIIANAGHKWGRDWVRGMVTHVYNASRYPGGASRLRNVSSQYSMDVLNNLKGFLPEVKYEQLMRGLTKEGFEAHNAGRPTDGLEDWDQLNRIVKKLWAVMTENSFYDVDHYEDSEFQRGQETYKGEGHALAVRIQIHQNLIHGLSQEQVAADADPILQLQGPLAEWQARFTAITTGGAPEAYTGEKDHLEIQIRGREALIDGLLQPQEPEGSERMLELRVNLKAMEFRYSEISLTKEYLDLKKGIKERRERIEFEKRRYQFEQAPGGKGRLPHNSPLLRPLFAEIDEMNQRLYEVRKKLGLVSKKNQNDEWWFFQPCAWSFYGPGVSRHCY